MRKILRLMSFIIIFVILINNSYVQANVVKIGETKYIERGEKGFYSIQYWNSKYQKWYYITYSRTYYTDDNGQKRIAYCCMPNANGVGWIPGEYEGYDTTIQYKLSNNDEQQKRLWRVFKNGYPYSSAKQLGVETDDDAYIATKQAAYFIIEGRTENEVYNHFRAGEDPVDGQDLNEIKRRGKKVVDAIYNLVKIGNTDADSIGKVTISKNGDIVNDIEYSYQEFIISNNNIEEEIEIKKILGAPDGTYTSDINGDNKSKFKAGEKFRIVFENKKIEKDYNISIEYKATCKNYPVFYAKSTISGMQDYLITVEKYDDEYGKLELSINSKKCSFELEKIDSKTKDSIPGVSFKINYKSGEEIGVFKTNNEGKIKLEDLKPGIIIVTEIETPNNYILDNNPKEIELTYNQTARVEIENKEIVPKTEKKANKKLPRTGF
ncbi:MAG: Cys-Gln thioester bond-forming surface protein [Clostridia bacterium]|nr:Cys-Gln thioester bond-forming surface protein [Clostridia bacterium]